MDPRCFVSGLPAHAASWPQRAALRRAAALSKPLASRGEGTGTIGLGGGCVAQAAPGNAVPELWGVP